MKKKLRWCFAVMGLALTAPMTARCGEPLRPTLDVAMRDPFAPIPVASAPVPVARPKLVVPPPAQLPEAPALNLTYAGCILDPQGHKVVFGSSGTSTLALTKGLTLPNGYQVETISETAVEFIYPSLGSRASLQIPTLPTFETR